MTPELWQEVQVLVDEALQRPAADRPAFLDQACSGKPELRQEVASLLAEADEATDFIEEPVLPLGIQGGSEDSGIYRIGQRIGRYEIRREVGSGGMGSVFLASRTDDYEKPVALKVLKPGMDTLEIVRRFQHERQILANLDHPNIAKLLDGGSTGDGRPFFVMERVEGEPLDRYCDRHQLTVRQRLELFRKVCSAVHFAHQNLVVHRDLKPGNILVNDDGEPKLLDFGIAKLLESERLSTQTPTVPQLTSQGSGPMTPRYASPEQVKGEAITTASDVYTLGVLLYKLLSGHPPYRLTKGSMAELLDAICDQDPARPSDVPALAQELPAADGSSLSLAPDSVAAARGSDPRALRRRLAGDLDSIVLKALRKEPKERYSSAEQLSEDISRHLQGLPVAARKGTFVYQTAKFFRRHSMKLAMATVVFLMLVFGGLWLASQNQAEAERLRADRERQISESLAELFQSLRGLDPKAGEEEGFAGRFQAEVRKYVDNHKLAEIINEKALAIEDAGGLKTAEILLRESLAMHLRLGGEEHPEVITGTNNVASVLAAQGQYDEAEELFRKALDLKVVVYGPDSAQVAVAVNNLGTLYQNTGRLERSEPLMRRSLEIRQQVHGADSLEAGVAHNNLGFQHQRRGELADADAEFRTALRILRGHLGLRHWQVAIAMRNLATVLVARGKAESAETMARQALEIFETSFRTAKHWRIADAESVLGGCLAARGRLEEATPLLTESYPIIQAKKGTNARETREALERLELLEKVSGMPGR